MEPELKTACFWAAAKLGIGLSLLIALIGIRVATVAPSGIESGIMELERLDAQITSESVAAASKAHDTEPSSDDSIVSKLSAGIRERMPSFDSRSRDGENLVSCHLAGRVHFMRADDCAMRGGQSTIVSREP